MFMFRMTLAATCTAVLAGWLAPGAASAATAQGAGGTLTYTAASGELNYVSIGDEGAGAVSITDSGTSVMTPSGTCQTYGTGQYGTPLSVKCTGITRVVLRLGDANDGISTSTVELPVEAYGEAGNDKLIDGYANDILDGGDGDDEIDMSGTYGAHIGSMDGADVIRGGAGVDSVVYSRTDSSAVNLSKNGAADDGAPNEGDNVGADVEVLHGGMGDDVLTGSDSADGLNGGAGNDTINGLGGDDVLEGLGGRDVIDGGAGRDNFSGSAEADTILARDGEVDTIACGSDADHAVVDASDILAGNLLDGCESVDRSTSTSSGSGGTSGGSATGTGGQTLPGLGVAAVKALGDGRARLTLSAPGPGTFTLRATATSARSARAARRVLVGTARRSVSTAGRHTVTLKPNRTGTRMLRRQRRLRAKVAITFAPPSGASATVTRTVTLRLARRR